MRTIIKENPSNIVVMDVMSALIENRVIFIDGAITEELASDVIAQLRYLNAQNHNEIVVYIKSCGGNILDGLAIYDTAKLIESPIRTVGMGCVASMACILMFMGEARQGLKHSRYMLHEPAGGTEGKYSEMQITLEEIKILRKELYDIIKEYITIENIESTLKDDTWYSAEEAKKCGILTEIL